jgi:hypothetical protein
VIAKSPMARAPQFGPGRLLMSRHSPAFDRGAVWPGSAYRLTGRMKRRYQRRTFGISRLTELIAAGEQSQG